MMDCSSPANKVANDEAECSLPRKPRILVGCCGCAEAARFGNVCQRLVEWAEVRAVVTKTSLFFIPKQTIPHNVIIYCDEDEWNSWKKIDDPALHIHLRGWADIMVIAPVSANTLCKIAGGFCDNLLTSVVRAWDYRKPLLVAPSMNAVLWRSALTEQHCIAIEELGIFLIPPVTLQKDNGDYEYGALSLAKIDLTAKYFSEPNQKRDDQV